jgi:hypothetical protein
MVMAKLTTHPIMERTFMSNNSQLATLDNKTTLTVLRMFLGLTRCISQLNSEVRTVLAKTDSHTARQKIPMIFFKSEEFQKSLPTLPKIYLKDLTSTCWTHKSSQIIYM